MSRIWEPHFYFNPTQIHVIQSVPSQEDGFLSRMNQDLLDTFNRSKPIECYFYTPFDLENLIKDLCLVQERVSSSSNPILHIDMHGDPVNGLKLKSGDLISWLSFSRCLGLINHKCRNRLAVISCICFSFKLIRGLDFTRPSPFCFLSAPSDELTIAEIEKYITLFYQNLIDKNDLSTALEYLNKSFSFYFPEYEAFFLLRDELHKYKGNKGKVELEKSITDAVSNNHIPIHKISTLRRMLRARLEAVGDDYIEEILGTFLCGAKPFFTIEDIKNVRSHQYWRKR